MAEPIDFFSIVIQASAGILGIIIAVVAVIHSTDIQARTPRTKDLFNNLVDLSQEYRFPFQDISLALAAELQNGLYQEMLNNYGKCEEIINNSDNYEWQKVTQAHVYRLECQLSLNNLRDYHTLSGDQLDAITDSAEWLMTNMSHSDATEKLYQEITGQSAGTGYMYDSILPQSSNLEDWLNDNNVNESGDDLESCFILCRSFASRAIPDIQKGRQETLVDYNSPLKPTLIATGVLLLVGVFTPSLFLLAAPNPILFSPKEIFLIQIGILIIVIGATGYLLYVIWNHLKSN